MPRAGLTPSEERPALQWAHDVAQGVVFDRFTDLADRLSWLVTSRPIGWLDNYPPTTPHGEHVYDGSCAICKAGSAPGALRIVIDAVLDAYLDESAFAAVVKDPDA